MAENNRISARQIANELQLSKDTVWRILTIQLEKRKVCSVWVLHNLFAANRAARVTSCIAMLQLSDEFNEEELLIRWATEDESWFNYHPLPTKQEDMAWLSKNEKGPRKAKVQEWSRNKTLVLMVFTADKTVFPRQQILERPLTPRDTWSSFVTQEIPGELWGVNKSLRCEMLNKMEVLNRISNWFQQTPEETF